MKTMIDILNVGNQEQFHSSMIAWLLDNQGEHGLGDSFISAFADILSKTKNGDPTLKNKLACSKSYVVQTEKVNGKSRYDIEIEIDGFKVIIENKTKSIGAKAQCANYLQNNGNCSGSAVIVPLGFCDVSFSSDVHQQYPFISYQTLLEVIRGLLPQVKNQEFSYLIEHYIRYLDMEFGILNQIDKCFFAGQSNNQTNLSNLLKQKNQVRENNVRFYNLYYLGQLEKYLLHTPEFNGTKWTMDKDNQSGPWIADYEKVSPQFTFSGPYKKLQKDFDVYMWFHLQLENEGIFSSGNNDIGNFHLRCCKSKSAKGSNVDIVKAFKGRFTPGTQGVHLSSRISNNWDTFMLASQKISYNQLESHKMGSLMKDFMSKFGKFI